MFAGESPPPGRGTDRRSTLFQFRYRAGKSGQIYGLSRSNLSKSRDNFIRTVHTKQARSQARQGTRGNTGSYKPTVMVDRPMLDYEKGKMLNKGAFGSAFLAKCKKTDTMVVIKMVDISKCSKKERDSARKEVSILGALKHPNIIEYKNSFEDGGFLCIVMAFAEGGDLTGKIKSQMALRKGFGEDQILDWFVQICLGLKHVHDRKILHRDLKSQNIFLTGSQKIIKLGDFGIAKVLDATNGFAKTSIGTPYYLVCDRASRELRRGVRSTAIRPPDACGRPPAPRPRRPPWPGCPRPAMPDLPARAPAVARDLRGAAVQLQVGRVEPGGHPLRAVHAAVPRAREGGGEFE